MIRFRDDGMSLEPLLLGQIMARFVVDFDTVSSFRTIDAASNLETTVSLLARATEFATPLCTLARLRRRRLSQTPPSFWLLCEYLGFLPTDRPHGAHPIECVRAFAAQTFGTMRRRRSSRSTRASRSDFRSWRARRRARCALSSRLRALASAVRRALASRARSRLPLALPCRAASRHDSKHVACDALALLSSADQDCGDEGLAAHPASRRRAPAR